MKVIFLDIDGVLNTAKTVAQPLIPVDYDTGLPFRRLGYHRFDPQSVERLNSITAATGAKIVISSTWRIGAAKHNHWDRLKSYFIQQGISGEIIGYTPYDWIRIAEEVGVENIVSQIRGWEIQAWINENGPIDNFVIIDDDSDMEHLKEFLVQTTWDDGLQDEHVGRVIEILQAL